MQSITEEWENELFSRYSDDPDRLFDRLYRKVYSSLTHLCYRYLHDIDEAEDAASETLLKAYRYVGSRPPEAITNLSSLMYGIAKNTCLDRLKYKRRRPAVGIAETDDAERHMVFLKASERDDPLLFTETSEMMEEIRNAIGRMPEQNRMPYLECYLFGRPYAEFARENGIPVGTVKSRACRGIRKIREDKRLMRLAGDYGIKPKNGETPQRNITSKESREFMHLFEKN